MKRSRYDGPQEVRVAELCAPAVGLRLETEEALPPRNPGCPELAPIPGRLSPFVW